MSSLPNPFDLAHDALRAMGLGIAALLDQTDFGDAGGRRQALVAVQCWLLRLQHHLTGEDLHTLPALLPHDRALAAQLAREHRQLEQAAGAVRTAVAALEEPAQSVSVSERGARLRQRVHRLIADHLMHLEREETEALVVLQRHLDQVGLARMRQSLTPPAHTVGGER